eukprot:gene16833-20016_t
MDVGLGGWSSFALTNDKNAQRKIYTWGNNGHGQMGIGSVYNIQAPTLISSLSTYNIVQVASGGYFHTHFLTEKGMVLSCGKSDEGQLAIADSVKDKFVCIPTRSNLLDGLVIKSIASGPFHSLAIDDKGDIYQWGCGELRKDSKDDVYYSPYSLFNGTPQDKLRMIDGKINKIDRSSIDGNVVQIVASDNLSMVLTDKGALYQWSTYDTTPVPITYPEFANHTVIKAALAGDSFFTITETPRLFTFPADHDVADISLGVHFAVVLAHRIEAAKVFDGNQKVDPLTVPPDPDIAASNSGGDLERRVDGGAGEKKSMLLEIPLLRLDINDYGKEPKEKKKADYKLVIDLERELVLWRLGKETISVGMKDIEYIWTDILKDKTVVNLFLSSPPTCISTDNGATEFKNKKKISAVRLHRGTVSSASWNTFFDQMPPKFGERILYDRPHGLLTTGPFPKQPAQQQQPQQQDLLQQPKESGGFSKFFQAGLNFFTGGEGSGKQPAQQQQDHTTSFILFVNKFLEPTSFDLKAKSEMLRLFTNLSYSYEDITQLTTSFTVLNSLSNNKSYPLLALYILMKIDNGTNGGIQFKIERFIDLLSRMINEDSFFILKTEVLHVLFAFVEKNLSARMGDVWLHLIVGVAIKCLDLKYEATRANLALAFKIMTIPDMRSETVIHSYKNLHDKSTFLQIFEETCGIFKEINNPEEHKKFYEVYETLLLDTNLDQQHALRLLPAILEKIDNASSDALKYRFRLVHILLDHDIHSSSKLLDLYGKFFVHVLHKDLDYFVSEYTASKKKDTYHLSMAAPLEAIIKSKGGLVMLLKAINKPELKSIFNPKVLVNKFDYSSLSVNEKVTIFNQGSGIPLLLKLQNDIIATFPGNLDICADYFLRCPNYPFTAPLVISNPKTILSISAREMEFTKGLKDVTLSKEKFPAYYDLCHNLIEKYVSAFKSKVPTTQSFESDKISSTLPFILLFTYCLKLINFNSVKLVPEFGRFATLKGTNNFGPDFKAYMDNTFIMQTNLQDRAKKFEARWDNNSAQEYQDIAYILTKYFHNPALPTANELNDQYNKDLKDLGSLLKVSGWLNNRFSFTIALPDNELPPAKQIESIKLNIFKAPGADGHRVKNLDSLKFLGYFTVANYNIFFEIIFKHYTGSSKDIDGIVEKTLEFMTLLINQSDNITLNDIFKRIIETKDINFKKELQTIFTYINPNKQYGDMEGSLHTFITRATSLFGIQTNIIYLDKFLDSHKDIIIVGNSDSELKQIHQLLAKIDQNQMTIKDSQQIFDDISSRIGGLNFHQLVYFSYIQHEIIEFFASFKERSAFETTNGVITQNLISDTYNNNLHNNTIHAYKMLEPFTQFYYNAKKRPGKRAKETYPCLKDFCAMVSKHLVNHTNLDVSFVTIASVIKELPQVKGLYVSAGGMYNSESILPTVVKLLRGSEFESLSTKCEDGAVGWRIKIKANSLLFDQEKIEDFVQGLKISSSKEDDGGQKNKTIKTFNTAVVLLRKIHLLHTELDRVYHPEFFEGIVHFEFSGQSIKKLQVIQDDLNGKLRFWTNSIKELPNRLWLLKAHGLSSLISSYVGLWKNDGPTAKDHPLDANVLASLLEPYVKYCFQSADVTHAIILDVLKANKDLTSKIPYAQFFRLLIDILEARDDIEDCVSSDRGPVMVHLESKNNIYNVLMQLNNSVLPHPSQLFYEHTFSKDIEYFFDTIEKMAGKVFFLIGIPKQKERLIQWLSEHFSNQKTNSLARLYIISTEKSASNDLFSFIQLYNGTFEAAWKNFKNQWTQVKGKGGIAELSLVSSPESGTGKSYFIRSKRTNTNNPITVHIRPNFDAKRLIDHLRTLNSAPATATKTTVMVHFSVSPYCDFDAFNHFIYPLLTYGFVFGQRSNEIINIAEKLQLHIFVEIGSPLIDRRDAYPEYSRYLDDSIPLIYNLGEKVSHTNTLWEVTNTEKKCYSYVGPNAHQKSAFDLYKNVKSMPAYLEGIKKLIWDEFKYDASFLTNANFLLQRQNFLKILEERLEFLDSYYDKYSETGLNDREFSTKFLDDLLPPKELHLLFVLEAIKLSDPVFSSAVAIWKNPPILTSRSKSDIIDTKNVEIEYVDFSTSNLLQKVASRKTMKTANESPGEFRTTIAQAFGITSRTGIIIHLCYQFGYVLTPDYAVRLLFLHNKVKNQRSLVLTGDTGVGKTFILLFYSLLVNAKNDALPDILYDIKEVINGLFKANPEFFVKDGKGNVLRSLPGDASIDMIVKALSQFIDYEPKIAVAAQPGAPAIPPLPNKDFQEANFATIEECIVKMIRQYTLIDLPNDSVLGDLKRRKDANNQARVILKKDKLLQAVTEICTAKFKNLFHRIIMHQKFTGKEFKNKVNKIINESIELARIDLNLKMVVFIDEFNTSPNETLSLINEIFIDGTLDGEACIPNNIFWIGAMNPPRKLVGGTVDYTGQNTSTSNLAFVVQPPPPSMEQMSLNYGEFSSESEGPFLDSLFLLKPDICPEYPHDDLKNFILVGQNALRDAKQNRTHVSIRDITRIIDLYKFFRFDPVGIQILTCTYHDISRDYLVLHWWSMVAAIGLTYFLRVSPGKTRNDLGQRLNEHYVKKAAQVSIDYGLFSNRFDTLFKKIYTSFCSKQYTNIPDGIALTDSLMQNIFCAAISINVRIPLCVVGPPGCSKTLSFGIVLDNMNANKHLGNETHSPWSLMPNADPFRYQCTPHTTDIEIKDKFEQALTRQGIFDLSGGKSRCVVFFDEAGLVNENDSPMKIMHDYLDKVSQKMDKNSVDISIIILSNKILDAAKTNRMMMLVHPPNITEEDERALVKGCLYNNEQLYGEQEKICEALCKSYKKVNGFTNDTKADLFHQRDFVYFLRHLARGIKNNNNLFTGEVLRNSLERNFVLL